MRGQGLQQSDAAVADARSVAIDDTELVRQIVNIVYFFCFFPSLIYAVVPTQTQPIAAALALPLLFLRPIRLNNITLPCLLLLGLMAAYLIVSLLMYPQYAGSILGNGSAYMLMLMLVLALYDKMHLLSPKPLAWAVAIWTAVGSIQALPFPGFIKGAAQATGRLMLERFVAGRYEESRGYSLLASEPSISAATIILMMLSVWFFLRQDKLSRGGAAIMMLAVGYMIFLNRSSSIAILLLLVFAGAGVGAFIRANWALRMLVFAGSIGVLTGLYFLAVNVGPTSNIRILGFLNTLVTGLTKTAHFDAMRLLVSLGAQRIIPIVLGYGALTQHYGLGHGIASWNVNSVMESVKDYVGIDYASYNSVLGNELWAGENRKPQSFGSLIAFDMGLVGFIPLLWFVGAIAFYRWTIFGLRGDNRLIYVLPALVWLALLPLIALPAPWLMLLYSLELARPPQESSQN
jgi:hypothetical protein